MAGGIAPSGTPRLQYLSRQEIFMKTFAFATGSAVTLNGTGKLDLQGVKELAQEKLGMVSHG